MTQKNNNKKIEAKKIRDEFFNKLSSLGARRDSEIQEVLDKSRLRKLRKTINNK